jgi:hypothetical protein
MAWPMSNASKSLPRIEISFFYEGERWIARVGDIGRGIEVTLDGGLHKMAAQLTTQLLQHGIGIGIKDIRAAVFAGPLAILLDRIIASQKKEDGR